MTARSKAAILLAPLACLFCPLHLLGYLLGAVFGWESFRLVSENPKLEAAFGLAVTFVLFYMVRKWEAKRGHHHCDQNHQH